MSKLILKLLIIFIIFTTVAHVLVSCSKHRNRPKEGIVVDKEYRSRFSYFDSEINKDVTIGPKFTIWLANRYRVQECRVDSLTYTKIEIGKFHAIGW